MKFYQVGLVDVRGLARQADCETIEEVQEWIQKNDHEGAGPVNVRRVEDIDPLTEQILDIVAPDTKVAKLVAESMQPVLCLTVHEVNGLFDWMSHSPGPDHHFPAASSAILKMEKFLEEQNATGNRT